MAPRPTPSAAPPAGSPEAAFAQATALDHRAFDKRARGDFSGAFLDIRAAWQQVSRFPDDENCRRLAGELFQKLDELAEESNAKAGGAPSPSTPLIVK